VLVGPLIFNYLAVDVFDSVIVAGTTIFFVGWMVGLILQTMSAESFRAFSRFGMASIFGGLGSAFLTLVLLAGYWLTGGAGSLSDVLLLTVIASFLNTIVGLALVKKMLKLTTEKVPGLARGIAQITLPFLGIALAALLLNQVGIWVIGAFFTEEDVALYGIAVRIAAFISMPLMVVNRVLPPIIAELHSGGSKERLERILRRTATLTGLIAVLIFATLYLFGAALLEIAFGEFYRAAAVLLVIIGIGQLFNGLTGSCGELLLMTGNHSIMLLVSAIAGVMTTATAILVASMGSVEGVAAVFAAGLLLHNAGMVIAAKKKLGIWSHVALVNPFPALRR